MTIFRIADLSSILNIKTIGLLVVEVYKNSGEK